jgi:hypothetical protein
MVKKLLIVNNVEDGSSIGNRRWKTELHILHPSDIISKVRFLNIEKIVVADESNYGRNITIKDSYFITKD